MAILTGVRVRRQRTGVKSGAFAKLAGYSRAAMISIENGTRPASPEGTVRIAAALTELGVPTEPGDLDGTVPDDPPTQPKREPKAPPKRQDQTTRGPKRATGVAA
jgi:DNA-binding XRE family transcriptional regulator